MATKTAAKKATDKKSTNDKGVIDLSTPPPPPAPQRGPWAPFMGLFDSFPSFFGHRWPDLIPGTQGFEHIKVEEQLDDSAYVIRAEIPGVDPDENIDISVDNGRLTIKAEREKRVESEEADEFRSEFHYGSFRRTMTLPTGATADDVTATYEDGILEVRVPVDTSEPSATKVAVKRSG